MKLGDINPREHVFCTQQFDKEFISELFELTDKIKKNSKNFSSELEGKIVSSLFYEPSTRTRFSFESAVLKLGGKCITTENASQFSSSAKGETIEDSISVINKYCDFIVMRHYDDLVCENIVKKLNVPFINAGTGESQHPTQTLLDVYTIFETFKKLDNLKICLVGDLFRGRTCSSLIYFLSKLKNNKFYLVSLKNCKIKQELRSYLVKNNIDFVETENLEEFLPEIDVCYMTRIQKERFSSKEEYDKTRGKFILNGMNVKLMKEESIVMHPLPRIDEISPEVDIDKRAKYFVQAENGLYIRMGLLKILNDYNYKK